jgi:hypothetical protein
MPVVADSKLKKGCIMGGKKDEPDFGPFDVNAIANGFPDTADTLLLDCYLTDG